MFLLWPDPPRAHKRRLRWKAAIHPHPEATVRGARSRRLSLVPVVPPIRRGLGRPPVGTAAASLDLPLQPTVIPAPLATASRADVRPPASRASSTALGALSAPAAARSAPASTGGFRAPHALRRVFARPLGPPFLSDRSPESDLLFVLSSATMGAAARAERALQSQGLQGEAARLVALVSDLAFGPAPLEGFWGDEPCVDSLRLRLCRSGPAADVVETLGFEGFYWWAGSRLGGEELSHVPDELLPDAAAAMAAVQGYRRAFELFAARASSVPNGEAARASRRLALRCALSGVFFPALVRFLLPPAALRLEDASAAAWEPAMLAFHAYRLSGHEAGTTHLAAAIVSTLVRDQIGGMGRRSLPAFRPREWGALPPSPQMEAEHRQIVAVVGVLATQLWWTYKRPWPEGWSGPDAVGIERLVTRTLGGSSGPAYDVFMDDTLAVAACHALQGHTPSARATLASTRTADVFVPTRDRLARALERGAFDQEPAPIVGTALARDFRGLLERLRNTPDPAEFGSPDWRRDALRGRLLSRLQQRGPRGLALALRTVLGPSFADLDRFWLAPAAPRSASVAALAAWLDRRAPVVPSDRDLILFLDDKCRQMTQ